MASGYSGDSLPVASTSAAMLDPTLVGLSSHDFDDSFSQGDEHEDGADGGPKKKKRKRNRQPLSCTACQKRKIKCDRRLPCESCIKREEAHLCVWEEKAPPPPPQIFALASDMDDVKRKLHNLESLLTRLVSQGVSLAQSSPGSTTGFSNNGAPHPSPLPGDVFIHPTAARQAGIPGAPSEVDSLEIDSATEDAAMVLEEIAMGKRRVYGSLRAPPSSGKTAPPTPQLPPLGTALTSCRRVPDKTRYVTQAFYDRDALLNLIWPALPPKTICDELIDLYVAEMDWSWHIHHMPSFRAEVAEFWQLFAEGRQNETDPAWLGVFCATLCVALNTRGSESSLGNLGGQELRDQPGVFFELCFTALRAAQWSAKPQVRVIQTCLLLGPFLTHFSGGLSSERAGHMLVWASSATRIAQLLGLHSLSSESGRVAPDDPAWPPGNNSLKREMAKRLWAQLVLLDWTNAARGGTYAIHYDQYVTPLPANVNDEDLGLHVDVTPRPPTELTDVSFECVKLQMARHQRRVQDRIRKGTYTYEMCLEIDNDFRRAVEDLCGPSSVLTTDSPVIDGKPTKTQWLRGAIVSALHNRLLRLHRPFLARGYTQPRFEPSTRSGIESARTIIRCHTYLVGSPCQQFWSVYVHTLGAALCLAMATLHDIDVRAPDEQINLYLEDMRRARQWFTHGETARNASVRAVAVQGGRIIASLIDAVQRHKAAWDAGDDVQESFLDILKRVASRLASSAPGSSGQPAIVPSSPVAAAAPFMHSLDPTLVDGAPTRDLLQSMGLFDNEASAFDFADTYEGWSLGASDGMGMYLGEGDFAPDPGNVNWSSALFSDSGW